MHEGGGKRERERVIDHSFACLPPTNIANIHHDFNKSTQKYRIEL